MRSINHEIKNNYVIILYSNLCILINDNAEN